MKLARQTYAGRATKWANINRFYDIKREGWPSLRKRQRDLLVARAFSPQDYKLTYNLENLKSWKWIVGKLETASGKKDPIGYLNQINIYKLEMCLKDVETELERIENFVSEQESLPVEETEGYKYNQRYNISVQDLQELSDFEFGTNFEE